MGGLFYAREDKGTLIMSSATALIGAARQADGSFAGDVPDGWLQGRTAYGGLTTAMAYNAARSVEENLPPLRSAQMAFAGPVVGHMHASATVLRRGKSSAFIQARVSCDGEPATLGTFLFMADRASPLRVDAPPAPAVPSPEEAEPAMRGKGAKAPQKPWDGAEGLEWEVPSPAPFHTFENPPKLDASATRVIG